MEIATNDIAMRLKLLILSLFFCLNSFGQKLPITGLCLADVLAVTGGTCLADAFTNANPAYFDPAYAVAGGDYLDDFRNYGTSCTSLASISTVSMSEGTNPYYQGEVNMSSEGTGCTVTEMGIVYGTSPNPTISGTHAATPTVATGAYSWSFTGPTFGTNYYYRAFATNSYGTAYGAEMNTASLPTVSSDSYTVTNLTSATGYGSISSDGGASVTAKGYCWGTSTNPTTADSHTSDGTGTGSFTSSLTSLNGTTTFYARAYATNSVGTAYGSNLTVNTSLYTTPYARLLTLGINANAQILDLSYDTTNPTGSNVTVQVRVENVNQSSGWKYTSTLVSYAGEYNVSHTTTLTMGLTNYTGDTFDIQYSIDGGSTWSGNIYVPNTKTIPYDINQ